MVNQGILYLCPGKISGVISKTAPKSDSAESAMSLPYDRRLSEEQTVGTDPMGTDRRHSRR